MIQLHFHPDGDPVSLISFQLQRCHKVIDIGLRKAGMKQVFLKGEGIHKGIGVRKMQLMGKSRGNDKGIACFQRHGAAVLLMGHPAAFHIADLVIVMPVGMLTHFAAGNAVDMVFSLWGQIEIIQRKLLHCPTSFFASVYHIWARV